VRRFRIGVDKATDGTWYGYIKNFGNRKMEWRTSQTFKTKRSAINSAKRLVDEMWSGHAYTIEVRRGK